MKIVINKCFGGFGLSKAAYEKLIEWGVPVRKYIEQRRNETTGLYEKEPLNDGEVIFDRELTPASEGAVAAIYHKYRGTTALSRYWDGWTREHRTHPMVVRVVEKLGEAASGPLSELAVVEIPDGTEYEISDYDGREHIAEAHRTWA